MPTPCSSAIASSASDFALPCRYEPLGSRTRPAARGAARRPRRRRSPAPPRRTPAARRCRGTPWRRRRPRPARVEPGQLRARTRAPARAGRPRRRRTPACRTRAPAPTASQPPMVSAPPATEESSGYTAAQAYGLRRASGRRGRARERRRSRRRNARKARAAGDHHDREQLRLGEAEQHLVVAADELDEEALRAGQDQVDGEQRARPPAVAPAPQQRGDEEHRQRLVDRRRVDLLGGRHGAVGIGHRPRAVPRHAVVAVAGELAADAAERVADGERRRRHVEHLEPEEVAPPGPEQHGRRAAQRAAVPDEARPGEEAAEEVVLRLRPVLGDPPQPRAHEPADERREDHLVRPVDRLAQLPQVARREDARRHEPQAHHQAEGLQRDGTEIEFGLHAD